MDQELLDQIRYLNLTGLEQNWKELIDFGEEKGLSLDYMKQLYDGYEEFAEEMQRYTVVVPIDWSYFHTMEYVANAIRGAVEKDQKFLRSLRRI